MPVKLFFILLTSVLFIRCQNDAKTTIHPEAELSAEDSLYKLVISYHDETMPKTGKLIGYKKQLQQIIDSLQQYSTKQKSVLNQQLIKKYTYTLGLLDSAENSMNKWMDGFDPDPKLGTKEERLNYWQQEELKARKMKNEYLSALDSAGALLNGH